MLYRRLGKTGLEVSALGFGCGAVGGLLVRGERAEMVRTVARAIEAGVNYFDTAPLYGNGQSETNLGWVLAELKADVIVGSKVRLAAEDMENIEAAIVRSVETSLGRLRRESIDLIQLHNLVTNQRQPAREGVTVADLERAMAVFARLQAQGKVRFWGWNGLGDTPSLQEALAAPAQTVQCCFNLLNPSAGRPVAEGFAFQDYAQLIDRAAAQGMGVIAIRVLAGGALSGSTDRHPNAAASVDPIASSSVYAADVALAQRLAFLIEGGYADSLVEAAIRFAIGQDGISTALVGISNADQLEQALSAAHKGPLPSTALGGLARLWAEGGWASPV
ncbi:MAG: aldo/keto reductase [Chloroflexi bacterium]|nr:MAG: aldo/keto reductase [Chloroflexota bacterium]